MRIDHLGILIGLAGASLALACGNPSSGRDVKSAHSMGHGLAKTYDVSFDQAWAAAHAVLRWDKAGAPEDHADEHYVVSNPDSSQPSYSSQVGMWLEPMNDSKTRVTVVVVAWDTIDKGGPDEAGVQKDFEKAIALVKSGQPLPESKP